MGTETILQFQGIINLIPVKLNNPLMGTETLFQLLQASLVILYNVKLNNPLMGTETVGSSTPLSANISFS